MNAIRKPNDNGPEGVGGRDMDPLLLGMWTGTATVEVSVELLQKTKIGHKNLTHLNRHLLCDFSSEDMIKCLFTPDKH